MTSARSRRTTALFTLALVALPLAACSPGSGRDSEGDDNDGANASAGGGAAAECGEVNLRLSHQWPEPTGDEGDFRSQIAVRFAEGVEEATDGQVKVTVYANSTLSKATEQYDAMMNGSIDASVFPLDYASGRVPTWSITLMPALVTTHEQAKTWDAGEIGEAVRADMKKNGLIALTDVWNAGGIGTKGEPIIRPSDVPQGSTMRAAGSYVEKMLEDAGAGISSMPSSEIYTAMQTGVLDAVVTSTGSFASYNLQEQVKALTSPTQNTFFFMYEPLVITTQSFDKLCPAQQEAVTTVGKDLQEYAYSASAEDDARVEKIFSEAGVEVVQMDDDAAAGWRELAQKQWDAYAKDVPGGKELLDTAKQTLGE